MNEPYKNWYLIYTKPRGEILARENLERQSFPVYLPMVRQMRVKRSKRTVIVEPLFPRYLFIQLDPKNDNWAPIRSTIGVTNIVRFGNQPSVVPMELVDLIKERDDLNGVQDLPSNEFEIGDPVRFREGPMYGYEGIFLAKNSFERVTVLLNIVGNPRRISATIGQLEKA